MPKFDYLIVGAGLFGAMFAYKAKQEGKRVLVIDKRFHKGGNLYCENIEGINVHKYGPHIFHTSNKEVWNFVNSIVPFNHFRYCPLAYYKGIVFTGKIDEYYDYQFGKLEYRSLCFEEEVLDIPNYQGNIAVNYTDTEHPYTRIIEHKYFEFGNQPKTVITKEYPQEWNENNEPYYPINDEKNMSMYSQYKKLADQNMNVIFGGRLAEYKYYDMHQIIEKVLNMKL